MWVYYQLLEIWKESVVTADHQQINGMKRGRRRWWCERKKDRCFLLLLVWNIGLLDSKYVCAVLDNACWLLVFCLFLLRSSSKRRGHSWWTLWLVVHSPFVWKRRREEDQLRPYTATRSISTVSWCFDFMHFYLLSLNIFIFHLSLPFCLCSSSSAADMSKKRGQKILRWIFA